MDKIFYILFLAAIVSCTQNEHTFKPFKADVTVGNGVTLMPDFEYNYDNTSGNSYALLGKEPVITHISNSSAYTFNANSGELIGKMNLNREGPAAIGNLSKFDGAIPITNNNMLYSCHLDNKILLVDKDSTRDVFHFSDSSNVRLVNSYQNPPIIGESEFVFSIFSNPVSDLSKEYSFIKISKDLVDVKKVVPFPAAYNDFYGGTPYLYWASITFNSKSNNYLVSYPIDHNLYLYGSDFELIEVVDCFHEEIGEIKPYTLPLDSEGFPAWEADREYYRRINHFVSLKYAPSFNGYTRMARIYDEIEDDFRWLCILYNEDLTESKVLSLDQSYSIFNYFTTNEGVLFLNEKRLTDERSISLPFDAIKVVEDPKGQIR